MVRQPLLSTRLAALSLAVSALLFAPTANTAVIGKTNINSAQHEPLSASIDVSDIDPDSFSVSVANDLLYQQMGMNSDIPINVTFVKTSDTAGKLILTSPQPVSEPFADVVLVVNDKGRAQSLPKTLLLPISKNNKVVVDKSQTIVGTAPTPKLPTTVPVVEPSNNAPTVDNSVVASNSTIIDETPTYTGDTTSNAIASNEISTSNTINATPVFPSQQEFLKADDAQTSISSASATSEPPTTTATPVTNTNTEQQRPEFTAQSNTDKQTDILSTEITRSYRPLDSNTTNIETLTGSSNVNKSLSVDAPQANEYDANSDKMPDKMTDANEILNATNTNTEPTPSSSTQEGSTQTNSNTQVVASTPKASIPLGNATYKVQRNDNLWTIAQQIASKNNVDVYTVMDQIQAYNPDAFINGKKSRLLANAELALPAYDVIPSKLGMQAAIQSRKTKNKDRASSKNVTAKVNRKKASKNTTKSARPNTTAAAKPRLKLVTPSKQGQATGTARKGAAANNGLNASLVASLEAARKTAAAQAQLVSGINASLSERARKLQLYNQKLAELEKRLKELRNK